MDKKMLIKKAITPPVLFVLLMIPHFKLPYFNEFDLLDLAFNGLRILSFVVTTFVFIKYREKVTKAFAALLCLQTVLLVSTLINGRSLYGFIAENLLQVAVFMLFTMFASKPREMIKVIFPAAEVLTYANLAAIIIFPNGLYKTAVSGFQSCWILGYKNLALSFYLCFMIVSALYNRYEKRSVRTYILNIAIIISTILSRASTCIIAAAAFVLLWFVVSHRECKFINSYFLTVSNIFLMLFVVVFRGFKLFSYVIEDILQESMTLSGRTYIWDRVFELIAERPILGWGRMTEEQLLALSGVNDCVNAHNMVLQYLLMGGVIALVFFCLFNFFVVKKLYMYRDTYTAKILAAALFAYNISIVVEMNPNPLNFIVFALADNIEKMLPYEKSKDESSGGGRRKKD